MFFAPFHGVEPHLKGKARPAHDRAPRGDEDTAVPHPNPHPSILIVADDAESRGDLARTAGRGGYSVEVAADGAEALAKLTRNGFGLVITDLKMTAATGWKLLRAVKQARPQVPVIVTSADGTVAGAVAAMQSGAADYLIRPFDPEAWWRRPAKHSTRPVRFPRLARVSGRTAP